MPIVSSFDRTFASTSSFKQSTNLPTEQVNSDEHRSFDRLVLSRFESYLSIEYVRFEKQLVLFV